MVGSIAVGRLTVSGRSIGLAVGDLVAIGLFVALGELRHAGTVTAGGQNLLAFGGSWIAVAALAGLYGPASARPRRRVAPMVAGGWIVAATVGQFLRVIVRPGAGLSSAFFIVSVLVGGVLLIGWRAIAPWLLTE